MGIKNRGNTVQSISLCCLALLVAMIFSLLGRQGLAQEKKSPPSVAVKVLKTTLSEKSRVVKTVGVLLGQKQVDIFSKVSGRITYFGPKEGDAVKSGTLLLKVDRSDPGDSFIPTPIVSPIDGWVGRWMVTSVGTQISNQDPLVTIVDDRVLLAKIALAAGDWVKVNRSSPAKALLQGEERTASITAISRTGTGLSSRGTMTIEIKNDDHRWKAGMVASFFIEIDQRPRLLVPGSALSLTDQGNFVYLASQGKAQKKPVSFVPFDHDLVEITQGLEPGLELIVEGVHLLSDGSLLKLPGSGKETST